MFILLFLILLVSNIFALVTLPSYVHLCSKSDPKIGDCIENNFLTILPLIVNGSKQLGIQRILPFHIDEVLLEATDTLSLKLEDINVYGLEASRPANIKIDFNKLTASLDLMLPKAKIIATYDIKGKILFLPILGHGPGTLEFSEPCFHLDFKWILRNIQGEDYAVITETTLNYTTKGGVYKFENLFNGNKQLGDQMNLFLNENWKEFSHDVSPAVSKAIAKIVAGTFNDLARNVPFKDLWLE